MAECRIIQRDHDSSLLNGKSSQMRLKVNILTRDITIIKKKSQYMNLKIKKS